MSVEIWPSIPPDQLKSAVEESQVSPRNPPQWILPEAMAVDLASSWVLLESPLINPPFEQTRELDWLIEELHDTLTKLKHGLEDCYALLAPIDPGSTLVVSTPRNEAVKGHVTRVGTRIVKGVGLFPFPPHCHNLTTMTRPE